MNLIKRIRPSGGEPNVESHQNVMRTWYCSYRIVRHRHMVLALNAETLFPLVTPLTSVTKTAGPTMQRLVHAGLYSYGIPQEIIDRECAAMLAWNVEKNVNRQMTGWMNDLWYRITDMIDEGLQDPDIASRMLFHIYGSLPSHLSSEKFNSPQDLVTYKLTGQHSQLSLFDAERMRMRWLEWWQGNG
ncbi:MAG: hypothetical protein FGM32_10670 [Candidatus Kapabacteria bacterium]|nr:hypothetical protein [Candidatus Kapabacteria bacterium]